MSHYVLDTDVFSLIQHDSAVVFDRIERETKSGHTIGLSIVSVEEQFFGWQKRLHAAKTPVQYAHASLLFSRAVVMWGRFQIAPETEGSRTTLQQLVKLKLNVGKNDLRIASVVLDLGATLVTRNLVDYRRVPTLVIEDWRSLQLSHRPHLDAARIFFGIRHLRRSCPALLGTRELLKYPLNDRAFRTPCRTMGLHGRGRDGRVCRNELGRLPRPP